MTETQPTTRPTAADLDMARLDVSLARKALYRLEGAGAGLERLQRAEAQYLAATARLAELESRAKEVGR